MNGDTVFGGTGTDTLVVTGVANLSAADLANVNGLEFLSLAAGSNTVQLGNGFIAGSGGLVTVLGNTGGDNLNGGGLTAGNRVELFGNGGADVLTGGTGDDRLFGGAGNDLLFAGTGFDLVDGGTGDDQLFFGAAGLNGDTVFGGTGTDTLVVTGVANLSAADLANVNGIEFLSLAAGSNSVQLGNGFIAGSGGLVTVLGNTGADTLNGGGLTAGNRAALVGNVGADVLTGGTGDDLLFGGADNDALRGGVGFDNLTGGAGNDTFVFEEGDISAAGNAILDFIAGGSEDSIVYNGAALTNGSTSGTVSYTAVTALGDDVTNATVIAVNVGGQAADTATQVAGVIGALGGFSADANDVVLFAVNNTNGSDSTVWRWADAAGAGGDGAGDVDVGEIEPIATLSDVTVDQLTAADFG